MTSEKLKGKIKSFSEKNNLKAQEVLQMYFFERFLTRLEKSRYRVNFIIKGGFLISSIIGIQNRTTMDIDTTIKGLPVKEEIIKEIILEILNIEVNDEIEFVLGKIENIREISEYENYRLHLTANFEKIKNPLKIDITTGDVIIPSEIEYSYETIFKEKLNILVYSLETLIAEKYETIIKRNITTTRLRDFYDIYMIFKLKNDKINVNNLKQAIRETAKNRNSTEEILESKEILEDIKKYSPYPEKVKLIAVTKYSTVEDIEEFLKTGQNICGENKVQVVKDKIEYFKNKNTDIKWHFIGNLQKNKVKYIIDDVVAIHSVNKLSLAQEINKKAEQSGKTMDVLLEINVYGEESKQGYSLDELKCDIMELKNLKNLNIIGVMTMAPFTDDEKILRMVFSGLRKIKDELNKEYFDNNLTELSMGMSNDYKIALQEGSTYIRVGTKIFK